MKKFSASEELILAHLSLVKNIAYSLCFSHDREQMDDLVSAGNLALCEVAQRFDPSSGVSFFTYAYRRIRGAMLDELCPAHRCDMLKNPEQVGENRPTALHGVCHQAPESWRIVDRLLSRGHLSEREERIIRLRYGIDCEPQDTQSIAELYGVSVQMINRVKTRALDKLRVA